jgi:hypothetical protein
MKNDKSNLLLATSLVLFVGTFVVSSGCSAPEPPQGEPIEFAPMTKESSAPQFQAPEGWIKENPSSAMRYAQYRLPGAEPSIGDAEVAVFAGIGGSVEQNVARWINQFETSTEPEISERTIRGHQVTLVDVAGTFSAGRMNSRSEPKEGHRMLAAVIETGGAPWFVKLVGPEETVAKWESSFTDFLESLQ